MIAISDASPLIGLGRLGKIALLQVLFDEVIVPEEVWHEVTRQNAALPGAKAIEAASGLQRATALEDSVIAKARLNWKLGKGETSTILIAQTFPQAVALLDDQRARRIASKAGLLVLGTLGVLERSHVRGNLPDLAGAYRFLLQGGHYLDRRLLDASLQRCGLPPL